MVVRASDLWLDVDGVLLDWMKPFLHYIKSEKRYDELEQYDIRCLFDGNVDKMVETINEFNSTMHYLKLEPLTNREQLLSLKERGWRLNIISQVDGELARRFRVKNLRKIFGHDMFHEIVLTGRKEKKVDFLRRHEPYETIYVVEDNPSFIKEAYTAGGFSCLAVQHPYNRRELKELKKTFSFPICTDINEVVRYLCL